MLGRLFKRRSQGPTTPTQSFEHGFPDVARTEPAAEFAHALAVPTVERSRAFVVNLLLGLVICGQAAAIYRMLPLKEVKPWIVEINNSSGEAKLLKEAATPAAEYKPQQGVLDRELFTFANALFTLNADAPGIVQDSLGVAYATYARDRATAQVRELVEREQPYQRMAKIPGLVRTVKRNTITYRPDAPVALVRFSTSERQRGQAEPIVKNYAMQVTYVIRPPSDPAEIERNPIGLYVVHFDVQEER